MTNQSTLLRDKIRNLQEHHLISFTNIARSTGYTAPVITEWMKGKYKGNVIKLEIALQSFVDNWEERSKLTAIDPIKFRNITNARKVLALCQIARLDQKMCVLVSESGLGKTAALREYSSKNPGTIMVDVDPTYNPKRLFRVIHSHPNTDYRRSGIAEP